MNQRILIQRDVWDGINKFSALINGEYETGGVFLGYRRGEDIHIIQATYPGARDKSSKYAFHRLSPHHQKAAKSGWIKTKGTLDWVGEWHTHPEKEPTPSSIDVRSWKQIAKRSNKNMFYSIHGYNNQWTGVLEFSGKRVSRKLLIYHDECHLLLS